MLLLLSNWLVYNTDIWFVKKPHEFLRLSNRAVIT
jgi:hypothetical protein